MKAVLNVLLDRIACFAGRFTDSCFFAHVHNAIAVIQTALAQEISQNHALCAIVVTMEVVLGIYQDAVYFAVKFTTLLLHVHVRDVRIDTMVKSAALCHVVLGAIVYTMAIVLNRAVGAAFGMDLMSVLSMLCASQINAVYGCPERGCVTVQCRVVHAMCARCFESFITAQVTMPITNASNQ